MKGIFLMIISRIFDIGEKWSDGRLWLAVFIASMAIILTVQLVLLPLVFPAWHIGDGLLRGSDSYAFNEEALNLAAKIEAEGWSAWELWPKGWLTSGLAGALYVLLWPKPWVLAPLNAAVHATTALLVLKIILLFYGRRRAALFAAIPYVFFPSAMLLYTQLHRDGYTIMGMLFFIYGFLLVVRLEKGPKQRLPLEYSGFLLGLVGIVFLWLARPHTVFLYLYISLGLFLIVFACFFTGVLQKKLSWKTFLLKASVLMFLTAAIYPFTTTDESGKYQFAVPGDDCAPGKPVDPGRQRVDYGWQKNIGPDKYVWASRGEPAAPLAQPAGAGEDRVLPSGEELLREFYWEPTPWLPSAIDQRLHSIALLRSVYFPVSYGEMASSIDYDVSFNRASDFIFYLPRALQIAFFAPFPDEWLGTGTYQSTTFFRRLSGLEMVFIYLCYIPLLYGIKVWYRRIELYIVLVFCTIMMLPAVYSTPNVGSIYRYRYGYLMLIVSLGVAAFCHFLRERRGKDGEETEAAGAAALPE